MTTIKRNKNIVKVMIYHLLDALLINLIFN